MWQRGSRGCRKVVVAMGMTITSAKWDTDGAGNVGEIHKGQWNVRKGFEDSVYVGTERSIGP